MQDVAKCNGVEVIHTGINEGSPIRRGALIGLPWNMAAGGLFTAQLAADYLPTSWLAMSFQTSAALKSFKRLDLTNICVAVDIPLNAFSSPFSSHIGTALHAVKSIEVKSPAKA